ncbi:DUF4381 domain-containing protein [Pelagimonas varians]|uniref:DUF4381 domain-containing protein n=1 Tax=Pelagimonas varians TaxID=696760 RepID=A0A238K943_9RHOB|nr:DUF4381 domain-containing protein [Pelagimonas varians]PYG31012.1 uncharacterized protein DUF4381 [Pelagimonas varians]SMX39420.1 hypothetical protein PEV8663_01707 [Pelagimonas varians]
MTEEELSKLDLVQLYDQLELLDPPPPISMAPETVGWLWLAVFVTVAFGYAVWRWRKSYLAKAYRRAALAALRQAKDDPVEIASLLRRTALVAFPRSDVASLHGAQWLDFLDKAAPKVAFSGSQAGDLLSTAPYQKQQPVGPTNVDLARMARLWIETHRPHKGAI